MNNDKSYYIDINDDFFNSIREYVADNIFQKKQNLDPKTVSKIEDDLITGVFKLAEKLSIKIKIGTIEKTNFIITERDLSKRELPDTNLKHIITTYIIPDNTDDAKDRLYIILKILIMYGNLNPYNIISPLHTHTWDHHAKKYNLTHDNFYNLKDNFYLKDLTILFNIKIENNIFTQTGKSIYCNTEILSILNNQNTNNVPINDNNTVTINFNDDSGAGILLYIFTIKNKKENSNFEDMVSEACINKIKISKSEIEQEQRR